MKQCAEWTLSERCQLENGHEGEHESASYWWWVLPKGTSGNPFARRFR